jgi:predicted RNA-binding Zn-ribbon protein involved in translation (DUF1610 family)
MKVDKSVNCSECGEIFNPKRKALGYVTCMPCGDKEASRQTFLKSRRTAPAYNKGAYMYVTNVSMAKDIGR